MTFNTSVYCDRPGCNSNVDGGHRDSTAEAALERAIDTYDWVAIGDEHFCENHKPDLPHQSISANPQKPE